MLVLAEVAGPLTGDAGGRRPGEARGRAADAASFRRATRRAGSSRTPPTNAAVAVTEIAWDEADALPFPLCISRRGAPGPRRRRGVGQHRARRPRPHDRRRVARRVPPPCSRRRRRRLRPVRARSPSRCRSASGRRSRTRRSRRRVPRRRRVARGPVPPARGRSRRADVQPLVHDLLEERGFTFRAGPPSFAAATAPAPSATASPSPCCGSRAARSPCCAARVRAATIAADPRAARPAVALEGTLLGQTEPWTPQLDLLGERRRRRAEFVVEVENDGAATLRFGDDVARPPAGAARVRGDVPRRQRRRRQRRRRRDRARRRRSNGAILGATNPLPAAGGTDPEPADAVRRDAPEAYLVQQRAVTRGRLRARERARPARPARGRDVPLDGLVAHRLRHRRPRRRPAGRRRVRDRAARPPRAVPDGRLRPRGRRPALRAARRRAARLRRSRSTSARTCRPPCSTCSRAARARTARSASSIPTASRSARPSTSPRSSPRRRQCRASQSVTPKAFQRQRDDATSALDTGVLPMGRLEIARLDDDPSFPERGVLVLDGGRRQVSAGRPCSCGCCAGVDAAHAARGREPARASRRSRTASASHSDFLASMIAGLTDADRPRLADARHARPRRLLDRAARRVGGRGRRARRSTTSGSRRSRTCAPRASAISLQELGRLIGYRLRPGVAARDVPRVRARAAARRAGAASKDPGSAPPVTPTS